MTYKTEAFALMRGCGDRQCKVKPAKGMAPNIGCQCFKNISEPQINHIIRTLGKAEEEKRDLIKVVEGLLAALPSATTHPAIKKARDTLNAHLGES